MHPVRLFLIVLALALTAPATQAAPFAYVPNVTGGSISVIDSATDTVTSTIPIPAIALTVNSTGSRVYAINAVAGPDSVRVHVIDTATNSVIATMPFGGFNQATSIALSSDDRRLYVGEFIGPPAPARISLAVFDTITNTRVANVDLGSVQPVFATVRSVAAEPAGTRVYAGISSDGTNIISEIERRCDEVAGRVDLGPGSFNPLSNVLINSAGTRLYALDSQQLRVIEPASGTIVAQVPIGFSSSARQMTISPSGHRVYITLREVGQLIVVDTASNTIIDTIPLAGQPLGVAVNPAGTKLYVSLQGANAIAVLNAADYTRIGTIAVGGGPVISNGMAFASGVTGPTPAEPLPPPNVRMTGMEVTQAIQDLANSVPLIQGRRTFVRVYVRSDGPAVPGVTATLSGAGTFCNIFGNCVTGQLGSLIPVNTGGPRITARPNPRRSNLNDSFLFELPWAWTNYRSVQLHVMLTADPGPPPQSCPRDVLGTPIHEFRLPMALKIQFVRLEYRLPGTFNGLTNQLVQTTVLEQQQSESFIRRTYPLSNLLPGPIPNFVLFDAELGRHVGQGAQLCLDMKAADRNMCAHRYITSRLAELQASSGFMGDAEGAYGLIPQVPNDPPPGVMRPIYFTRGACCTNRIGSGPSNDPDYAAHEILHLLGRGHPEEGASVCGHDPGDPDYPYALSFIGPGILGAEADLAGFDGGDASLSSPIPMSYWFGQGAFDNIGYCKPAWVSDYTYKSLFCMLGFTRNNPDGTVSPTVCGRPRPGLGAGGPQTGDWLMVFGEIDPDLSMASFDRVQRLDEIFDVPPRSPGNHSIRLIGEGGITLADYPFAPEEVEDANSPLLQFGHVVPFVAGTQAIQIVDTSAGSTVIGTKTVSANPPVISNAALQGQPDPATGAMTVGWTASDPDGDPLRFDIFLKRDDGASLQPLALSLSGTSVDIDTASLGGGVSRFRVVATDGVHTAFADTPPFSLANKPPRPRILNPGDGGAIYSGQLINLEGEAADPQDGVIPDTGLAWTTPGRSLGSGSRLSITDLPVGVNRITLTATNSLGLAATATASVTVKEVPNLPGPTLTAGPGQIGWHVGAGESQLQTAELDIGNSGSGNLEFTAHSSASWLSLSPATGTAPATLILTADPGGFAEGVTEEANVTLTAAGNSSQVITVPVTLSVGNTFAFGKTTSPETADQCPDDPDKTQPGACGCGIPDTEAGQSCTTGLPGMCSVGVTACASGALSCAQTHQPSPELCDGMDNNCDGIVDEGCAPVCAANVSPQVTVTRGGFRRNSATGRYVQQITLKNNGSQSVSGPVSLVLDSLSGNVALFNKSGDTSCATPVGPYKNVGVGADNLLGPGESATVILEFTNPSNQSITYSTRVLAGTPQ